MPLSGLKTSAEKLRLLLEGSLVSTEAVRDWADGEIVKLENPPPWLCEVSTARSWDETLDALKSADGEFETKEFWPLLMKDLLVLLNRKPEEDSRIAKLIHDLGLNDKMPAPGLSGEMLSFWDSIDLARDGVCGVLETQRERLRKFLEKWSHTGEQSVLARG